MKIPLQIQRKLIKIMQISVCQAVVAMLFVTMSYAHKGSAQAALEQKITLNFENISMEQALDQLQKTTGVQFIYAPEIFEQDTKISMRFKNNRLNKVLDKLLGNSRVSYEVINNHIVLKRNAKGKSSGNTKENNSGTESAAINVTGVITDEKGLPLVGVVVAVKGTSIAITTDADGKFSINAPDENSVLAISYIGYLPQEVVVGNQTSISIKLAEDTKALDEVVVVGYGEVKRSDLIGAVGTISPKEMKNLPVARVDQALQGRAAGVVIQNNDASPNGSVTIRVRGANSIVGGNDPLVVINGLIGGDLSTINPNDIENVEVLKDASATAIYGSRGANGVILVTTKKGESGKVTISYNNFLNFQSVRKKLDLLNAGEYAETVNANRSDLGLTLPYTDAQVAAFKANGGTDWQDAIFQNALQQSHQIGISGGGPKTNYYLSGNYVNNGGIIKNTSFQRYSLRSNIQTQVNDRLKVVLNLFLSQSVDHPTGLNDYAGGASGSPVYSARLWAPTLSIYDADGSYTQPSNLVGPHSLYNPVALAVEPIRDNKQTITEFNTYGEYTIAKGLTAKVLVAGRMTDDENSYYFNQKAIKNGTFQQAGITNNRTLNLQNTNQLTYQTKIADVHSINATAVFEQQITDYNTNFAGSTQYLTDALTYNSLQVGNTPATPYSNIYRRVIQSFLGRVNYSYKDKYLFNVSARSDGSSVFGDNNKRGFFPSVGAAWRVNNENFMKNIHQISNLKVRASFGMTGNQQIPAYSSLAQLNTSAQYAINGSTLSTGVALGLSPGNPNLKWETTSQFDFGVDLGAFNNRVQFTFDYYQKNTSNLLMYVPLPYTSGYLNVLQNVGEVQNKGYEFSLGGKPLAGAFTWNTNFNIAFNNNKVIALNSGASEIYLQNVGLPNFGNTIFLEVGQPMGVLKGYIQNGVWGSGDATQAAQYGSVPGAPRYVDENNDGKIDEKDIVNMGNTTPKFTFGFTNTFTYKNFDLNVLIQGISGNKIYNLGRVYTDRFSSDADATSRVILDRWTPTHQNTNVPSFIGTRDYEKLQSSRWLEDGSYLRFKNITFGYTLPKSLMDKVKISSLRFYVSAVNLVTITSYTGYDPEARIPADGNAQPTSIDTRSGIDLASYPSQKSYTVGMNVTF